MIELVKEQAKLDEGIADYAAKVEVADAIHHIFVVETAVFHSLRR